MGEWRVSKQHQLEEGEEVEDGKNSISKQFSGDRVNL